MVELVDTLPWGGSGQIHGCASSSLVRRTTHLTMRFKKQDIVASQASLVRRTKFYKFALKSRLGSRPSASMRV